MENTRNTTRLHKADLSNAWCWSFASEVDKHYHDIEWGIPVRDERAMFEHLSLECLQCGLSWNYILSKRELLREHFFNFEIDAVAAMDEVQLVRLLDVPGMLKSPRKLRAVVRNAQAAQVLRDECGGLADYFWSWSEGRTIFYEGHDIGDIPASNGLSARIAKDLKRRGFSFVGPTNIYAHLQACGIICDHHAGCERADYVRQNFAYIELPRDNERKIV